MFLCVDANVNECVKILYWHCGYECCVRYGSAVVCSVRATGAAAVFPLYFICQCRDRPAAWGCATTGFY